MINFNISEFVIDPSGGTVQLSVADKILRYHISIIQPIREAMGCPIWPSQGSGYRSIEWEKAHGRSGSSQHCFSGSGLGAVDWTAGDSYKTKILWDELKESKYKRICYYPDNNFIHADYQGDHIGQLRFFCEDGKNWIRE